MRDKCARHGHLVQAIDDANAEEARLDMAAKFLHGQQSAPRRGVLNDGSLSLGRHRQRRATAERLTGLSLAVKESNGVCVIG